MATRRLRPTTEFETPLWVQGATYVAGLDEAGRGAWAGPVTAAAVILNPAALPAGLDDSKRLTPAQRNRLYIEIEATAYGVGVGVVNADVIDQINIVEATRRAMAQAVAALPQRPDFLLLDALHLPAVAIPQRALVHGDARSISIAAASIIAKVYRDRLMDALDAEYPAYGFARHKGYGTAYHQRALERYGPCPAHRLTFRGVAPAPLLKPLKVKLNY
ncbi:MAG: ribonuclease HII [Chloracidobacterium sp.]|nr:ribonuclease HII [Chloracidobacterium sp.]MDW8216615.1 ribonuclease HII [Acidobacteriota bacterium]